MIKTHWNGSLFICYQAVADLLCGDPAGEGLAAGMSQGPWQGRAGAQHSLRQITQISLMAAGREDLS